MITAKTSVNGTSDFTAEDLVNQFTRTIQVPTLVARSRRIAPYYVKWCEKFNKRVEVAWAQMEHETGFLQFRGDARPEWNNFAGLGITGAGAKQTFETEELGVIAQIVHLCWYYDPAHHGLRDSAGVLYCSMKYDPRHFGATHYMYNGDTSIDRMSGSWAVPGRYTQPNGTVITYGGQIARLARQVHHSSPMVGTAENLAQKFLDFINRHTTKDWQYVAWHHSVSDQFETTMAKIRQWHLARNFLREGYNFGIDGNGKIETGRPLDMSGAHVGPRYNGVAIGVCLYGDFRYDTLTAEQRSSAYSLAKELMFRFDIPLERNLGHREFPGLATLCPSIDMNKFRRGLAEVL